MGWLGSAELSCTVASRVFPRCVWRRKRGRAVAGPAPDRLARRSRLRRRTATEVLPAGIDLDKTVATTGRVVLTDRARISTALVVIDREGMIRFILRSAGGAQDLAQTRFGSLHGLRTKFEPASAQANVVSTAEEASKKSCNVWLKR